MKEELTTLEWSLSSVRDMQRQKSASESTADREKTFSEIDAPFLEALERVQELMEEARETLEE